MKVREAARTAWSLWQRRYGLFRAVKRARLKRRLGACGTNVTGFVNATFWAPENVYIGSDVRIQPDIFISAIGAPVRIGSKVMLAPGVAIVSGNHNTSVLGSFMYDVTTKRPQDDEPVTIEDDVWVGMRAIILKGVTLHRGCVVGAGSIVNRDVPAYSVASGIPARVVGYRFTPAEVAEHELRLYGRRLTDTSERLLEESY